MGFFKYWKMNNQIFKDNLVLIDSNMDKRQCKVLNVQNENRDKCSKKIIV